MTNQEMAAGLLAQAREIFQEAQNALERSLASGSRRLRSQRERSFYGDEATGRPPHKLYTEDDARKALDDAAYTVEGCGRLIEGLVD